MLAKYCAFGSGSRGQHPACSRQQRSTARIEDRIEPELTIDTAATSPFKERRLGQPRKLSGLRTRYSLSASSLTRHRILGRHHCYGAPQSRRSRNIDIRRGDVAARALRLRVFLPVLVSIVSSDPDFLDRSHPRRVSNMTSNQWVTRARRFLH